MMEVAASLPVLDVYAIRRGVPSLHGPVTQAGFAARFGFSPATVRDWEQRRRVPDGAARTLLGMIAVDPIGTEWLLRRAAVKQDAGRAAAVHVGDVITEAFHEADNPPEPALERRACARAYVAGAVVRTSRTRAR